MNKIFRVFGVVLCLFVYFSGFSQMSVKGFIPLETDLDANTNYPKKDLNGRTCAIIKIFTTEKDFTFDVGQVGIVDVVYKTAEIWLYVPEKTRKLKIVHPLMGHLTNAEVDGYYWFPEEGVVSGRCYKLELVTGTVRTIVEEAKIKTGWVVVNSVPEEAEIYLAEPNGEEKYIGISPVSKKMPYGNYTYRAKKYKYHDDVGLVIVDSTRVSMTARLRPAFGSLSVNSEPQGASVIVNGQNTGMTTPCTISEVTSGNCDVRLQLADYAPSNKVVQVADGQTVEVFMSLEARFAPITINSQPGASIKVNGVEMGVGSYTSNLQEGIYDIEVSQASHRSATKQIEVVAGVPQTIDLQPTPIYGILDVNSSPMGASITINGKSYGDTPTTIEDLLVGDYEVVLSKPGYATATRKVTIAEKQASLIDEKLQNGRSVHIATDQSGDEIYVDGTKVGTSPCSVELTFGSHDIKAVRGGKSVNKNIMVTQGTGNQSESLKFGITPVWHSSVTDYQRRVLERLISNMVKVEGGTFIMGATSEQGKDANNIEKPALQVTVSDFYIGKYEVTQKLWTAVMGSNPSNFKGENLPVESVSWSDCQSFITKLNKLTGLKFRLPTEAEWEYAARGGNKRKGYKYSGSKKIKDVAWYSGNSSFETFVVGIKQPNELGIYDMSGNVWEWCSDWYGSYTGSSQTNPTGSTSGSSRVLRGGSWNSSAGCCRVSYRYGSAPSYRDGSYGFRLVLVP